MGGLVSGDGGGSVCMLAGLSVEISIGISGIFIGEYDSSNEQEAVPKTSSNMVAKFLNGFIFSAPFQKLNW